MTFLEAYQLLDQMSQRHPLSIELISDHEHTGSAGFIGSALVKKLLENGYTVHATVRNLYEESKISVLRRFPNADTRLHLFEADIYKPEEFERAIQGCEYVFHVATPWFHSEGFQFKNRIEATVAATKTIAMSCIKLKTVKRLVYTASTSAASPLKEDGTGYKDTIDETCWTPLNLSLPGCSDYWLEYVLAKTLAEKEILSMATNEMEVVTLTCGLVGGNTDLPYTPQTVGIFLGHINNDEIACLTLKALEILNGKVPIVHIEDVCRAHIFSIETPSMNGRFLCASEYISVKEIARCYQKNFPEFHVKPEHLEVPENTISWGSTKLNEKSFEYKHDLKMILDDCINVARKNGDLKI